MKSRGGPPKKRVNEDFLAIDVGNTSISFGVFSKALKTFHLDTQSIKSSNFSRLILNTLGNSSKRIRQVAIASVVPKLDPIIKDFCQKGLGIKPYFIDYRSTMPLKNLYKSPKEVGADRIVNSVAAWKLFKKPVVVVDFGTATTFDCITSKGEYAGGLIVPGPDMASKSLYENTAKLPFTKISKPAKIIGRTPKESIQSGLYFGYVSLVDGILDRLLKILGPKSQAIATGGLAGLIAKPSRRLKKSSVYPNLTLEGIKMIWDLNE